MKILIGLACLSVIALAAYFIGGDLLRGYSQRATLSAMQESDFSDHCDEVIERTKSDTSDLTTQQRRAFIDEINECEVFLRTGKMP